MTPNDKVQILKMNDPVAEAVDEMDEHDLKKILIGDEDDPGQYYVLSLFDIKQEDVENDRKIRELGSRLHVAPVAESGKAISEIYTALKNNPLVVVKDVEGALRGVVTMSDYTRKLYGV